MAGRPDRTEILQAAVIGGGPAGLTTGIALANAGIRTALIAPAARADNRTTALLDGSVKALEALGVWGLCREQAAPLTGIRIVDDRGGLLRAPEVLFQAEEIGLPAFGYNITNIDLVSALSATARTLPALSWIEAPAMAVEPGDASVTIGLGDGAAISAQLVAGADGRDSLCRRAAGIATTQWAYPQIALTCNLGHRRPHGGISTEFHTPHGPFTLVPLAEGGSSLVWVTHPARADALLALDDAAFAHQAERQAHSLLGKFDSVSPRAAFPLSGQTARPLAARRIALIGEAAHVFPPIGAQGFNLGLRDAVTLAEIAVQAERRGDDPGGPAALAAFDRARRTDVESRSFAVDVLNRSLLSDFLPVQGVRTLGLMALDSVGPLRRALMRQGAGPQHARLLRGEAL